MMWFFAIFWICYFLDLVMQNNFYHTTVLCHETVDALIADSPLTNMPIYVDATFGRGGHSRALLEKLPKDARLFVFDKDPSAIKVADELADKDARVTVIHDSFAHVRQQLLAHQVHHVDGIMADLGVSSPQLDDAKRGFSFMHDGAVDMRMNNAQGLSAAQWLQDVDEETLANVLYEFGEERYSRRIAKAIKAMPNYDSTLALATTIKTAHPKWEKNKHPATKSFQAIRIFINNELADIDAFINQSIPLLKPDGVLAVISFHSLEDRRIKQFLQRHSRGQYPEDEHLLMPPMRPKYFSKPKRIAPSKAEVSGNKRSRSAWLRVAKRTSTVFDDANID